MPGFKVKGLRVPGSIIHHLMRSTFAPADRLIQPLPLRDSPCIVTSRTHEFVRPTTSR